MRTSINTPLVQHSSTSFPVPDMAEAAAGCLRQTRVQALRLQQAAQPRAQQPQHDSR